MKDPLGVSWRHQAGIELTYVHPREGKGNSPDWWRCDPDIPGAWASYSDLADHARDVTREVSKWGDTAPMGYVHRDPGCLEASSPVLYSWEEAKSYCGYAKSLADMHGLKPYSPRTAGGMGHIHVQVKSPDHARIAFLDMLQRPYVAWAFAHPSAVEYCEPIAWTTRGYPSNVTGYPRFPSKWVDMPVVRQFATPEFGTTKGSRTLEFRMFNSARTWKEQTLHMAFVQRYMDMVDHLAKDPQIRMDAVWGMGGNQIPNAMSRVRNKSCRLAWCVREFNRLITKLGLPWEEYEGYVVENLETQFEWGFHARKISLTKDTLGL